MLQQCFCCFQKTDLLTKCLGPVFVMLGMTSMLLRVLFSRRPTVLANFCVEKKKKEKTVFDTRCRCDKCVKKRKLEPELDSLAPTRKNKSLAPAAPSANIRLESLQRRKTTSEGRQQRGEEIILKVPQVTSSK